MSKKIKVYFKKYTGQSDKGSLPTLYNLKNFPGTAQFIAANWKIIAAKNKILNATPGQRNYVAVLLGVRKEIFEAIIKDLDIPYTKEIKFYYETGHTHFLSLVPERTEQEIQEQRDKEILEENKKSIKADYENTRKAPWYIYFINKIVAFFNI